MSKSFTFALIGMPLSHSLSPRLHQAAFQYAQLTGIYLLCEIPSDLLIEEIARLIAQGINGFNVTIPHKQALFTMVQSHTPQAQQVGAINAVKVEDTGELTGHNTDFPALKSVLEKNYLASASGKIALILGTGGGARAAACAIKKLGFATCYVLARNPDKQKSLIDFMQEQASKDPASSLSFKPIQILDIQPQALPNFSLVINATSIGLTDESPPIWMPNLIKQLPYDCFCYDLVYKKNKTLPLFAQLAHAQGLKSMDGLDMLIEQARLSFQFWTGFSVPFNYLKLALSGEENRHQLHS